MFHPTLIFWCGAQSFQESLSNRGLQQTLQNLPGKNKLGPGSDYFQTSLSQEEVEKVRR